MLSSKRGATAPTIGWLVLLCTACTPGGDPVRGSDAGPPVTCVDADGDGASVSCSDGSRPDNFDCDDADSGRHPGAIELCDGADQDCDDSVDEEQASCLVCESATCLGAVDVAAGTHHACGLVSNGSLYCWGTNAMSELGTPDVVFAPTAVRVTELSDFAEVEAEGSLTCARRPGQVLCWGRGVALPYELAIPADTTQLAVSSRAVCTLDAAGGMGCRYGVEETGLLPMDAEPLALGGMTDLAVAGRTACGLDTAGAVTCWDLASTSPTGMVIASSGAEWLADGGDQFCARIDGELQCWAGFAPPEVVLGMGSAVDAFMSTTTRCAQGASGTLACWVGETPPISPSVGDPVALGADFGCAADAEHGVRCWGAEAFGALGHGVSSDARSGLVTPHGGTDLETASEVVGTTGACRSYADAAALYGGAPSVISAASACVTTCDATLDPAACLEDCKATSLDTLVSRGCGDCFVQYWASGHDPEALTECVGYRWSFLSKTALRIPRACRAGECTGLRGMGRPCSQDDECASQQCGRPSALIAGGRHQCIAELFATWNPVQCETTVDVNRVPRCTRRCTAPSDCTDSDQCIGSRTRDMFWCREGCRRSSDCSFGTCTPTSDYSTYYCD